MLMKSKYFLYIDILGFSKMVEQDSPKVKEVFSIIDKLNVFHHESFETVFFSDTLLVFNKDYAVLESDKNYFIMFLIEFVEDLYYRLADRNIFFRGFLVEGDFEYEKGKNILMYYGKALLKAYDSEKSKKYPYTGLLIENKLLKNNLVFPTKNIDSKYSFVYINQELEEFYQYKPFPVDSYFDEFVTPDLIRDLIFLKQLYRNMNKAKRDDIKLKMKNTFNLYSNRYPDLINTLVKNNFDYSSLASKKIIYKNQRIVDEERIERKFKSFNDKQIISILNKAIDKGKNAAIQTEEKITTKSLSNFCGWLAAYINLDKKSESLKILQRISKQTSQFSIKFDDKKKMYRIIMYNVHNSQSLEVDKAAWLKMQPYLEEELGIKIYLETFYD